MVDAMHVVWDMKSFATQTNYGTLGVSGVSDPNKEIRKEFQEFLTLMRKVMGRSYGRFSPVAFLT
jgi:hypothetical protein